MKAIIAFEDGRIFEAKSFTGEGEAAGEVVFNTAMTGYQEVLTDPSYKGQIVTMTYPLIGNYGVNEEDVESSGLHLEAFIVREYEDDYSSWRADKSLKDYLIANNKLGIHEVDTRAITRHIRLKGAMKAVISTDISSVSRLIEKARDYPSLEGRDLVKEVAATTPYTWENDRPKEIIFPDGAIKATGRIRDAQWRVVCIDCGLKYNQLRLFTRRDVEPIVVPPHTGSDAILSLEPHGVFISNGPGDPAALPYIVDTVKGLLGKVPLFGICLGHQILSQALGARTYKLKFGHHGANQPVKDLSTGKIEITSQNHGFSVDAMSLPQSVAVTHINLNDETVEGIEAEELFAFSVQYHPENAPGPHDSEYLFDRFLQKIRKFWA